MSNIFLVDPRLGPEDRFTFSWTYVLNTVPGLGQRFVDYLASECGMASTEFRVAIDHPRGTQRDRPDCLLRCEHWDALFEHKLDAELGPAQLERYLELAEDRGRTYLGLIAPSRHAVSNEVTDHAKYIRPSRERHLLWQSLYPLVQASDGVLARHFCEYMTALGIQPWRWGSIGDPLTSPSAEESLRGVFNDVASALRQQGYRCIVNTKAFAVEFRAPLPGIHLAYLKARQSMEEFDFRVPGRVLILKIWIDRSAGAQGLKPLYGYLRGSTPRVFVAPAEGRARWNSALTAERLYLTSLDDVLGGTPEVADENIQEFTLNCLRHLAEGVGFVRQERR